MQVYDSAAQINLFRMRALRGALKLEVLGMKRRGRSAYVLVKEEFGLKGNRVKVLKQLELKIEETVVADSVSANQVNTQGYGGSTRAPTRTDEDLRHKSF
jgi:hypothetical protein